MEAWAPRYLPVPALVIVQHFSGKLVSQVFVAIRLHTQFCGQRVLFGRLSLQFQFLIQAAQTAMLFRGFRPQLDTNLERATRFRDLLRPLQSAPQETIGDWVLRSQHRGQL